LSKKSSGLGFLFEQEPQAEGSRGSPLASLND